MDQDADRDATQDATHDAAHDAARAQILDAASTVFQVRGFDQATIDDIAEAIGATKGRVYYYFRSKFDIYLAVYEEGMRRVTAIIRPLAEAPGTGLERLRRMSVRHLVNLMSDPGYHDVITQGVVAGRSRALKDRQRRALVELNDIRQRYEEMFRVVVEQGVADGSLHTADPRLATRFLLSSLNGTAVWFRPRGDQDATAVADLAGQLADLALHGIAGSTAPAASAETQGE